MSIAAAACAVIIVALVSVGLYSRARSAPQQVPFSDLLQHLDQGEVTQVVVNGDLLEFTLAPGHTLQTLMPANYVTANPTFVATLAKNHVRIDVHSASEPAISYSSVFVGISLLAVLCFTVYRVTGGRTLALDHKTQEAGPEDTAVTFADVAGIDEAKEEVKEIVEFLREPQRFVGDRRPDSQRRAAGGRTGNGQDTARAFDCRRSESAVRVRQRIGVRGNLCRRRRQAHPQAVQGCAASSGVHHLHRRVGRGRPRPWRRLAEP